MAKPVLRTVEENDPMDGRIVKRPFTFVNPKLSTRAAERRRTLARVLRRLAAFVCAATAAILFCVERTLPRLALALSNKADQLDKNAKKRQRAIARRALNAWVAQETAEPTPPARSKP